MCVVHCWGNSKQSANMHTEVHLKRLDLQSCLWKYNGILMKHFSRGQSWQKFQWVIKRIECKGIFNDKLLNFHDNFPKTTILLLTTHTTFISLSHSFLCTHFLTHSCFGFILCRCCDCTKNAWWWQTFNYFDTSLAYGRF